MSLKRTATRVTIGLLATLMLSIPALAAPGDIDVDTVTDDKDGISPTTEGDCRVYDTDGDSWEATLYYKGAPQGSVLLCGPATLKNANGSGSIVNSTKWTDSEGQAPLVVGTQQVAFAKIFTDVPGWNDSSAFAGYGTVVETMQRQILTPIKERGGCGEYAKLVEMLTNVPTMSEEEIQAKLDSGEYFPFFVSFRPVLLYHRTGYLCDGTMKICL